MLTFVLPIAAQDSTGTSMAGYTLPLADLGIHRYSRIVSLGFNIYSYLEINPVSQKGLYYSAVTYDAPVAALFHSHKPLFNIQVESRPVHEALHKVY